MFLLQKNRKVLSIFLAIFCLLFSLSQPVLAIAQLPKGREWEFSENNIVFYNPSGKKKANCLSPDRGCQTSDGSDISMIGDGFLANDAFKKQIKTTFSKVDTSDTNFITTSNISFDDFLNNATTKTFKKNIIISYGTESNIALTKEQINKIILAVGSSKTILFLNNYKADGSFDESNKNIEEVAKTYQNFKIIDFASKISSDQTLVLNNQLSDSGAKQLVGIISSILNSGCSGSFTKYNFTDGQLRGITAMAIQENGLSPPTSVLTEASQMANLFESPQMQKYNKNANKEQGFLDMLLKGGWYASATKAKYSETANVPDNLFNAVKLVLNSGKRTLPTGVVEHDSLSDIASISNDGVVVDKNNKANYISKKTIIKNKMSSTYVFYRWSDPNASDRLKGDPFGYFQDKGIGEHENESNTSLNGTNSTDNSNRTASNTAVNSTGPASDPDVVVTSDFKNYAGDIILNQTQRDLIAQNRPVYEEAAKEYGFPWQILAALHYREHGLSVSNPSNGQGIYQLYSYTQAGSNDKAFRPTGPVSTEEFLRQSKITASIVKKMESDLSENPDSNLVKHFFFHYNGMAKIYKDQALDMGFTVEQANNGEGSPYVMSRADAKRDSTKGNMTWKMFIRDNVVGSGRNETNFGAYVVYLALGGFTDNSGTDNCIDSSSGSSGYSGGGNDSISKTAIDLSWHHYDTDDETKRYFGSSRKYGNNKYIEAQHQVNNVGNQTDCGRFVSVVMRYSGVDPNFPPVDTTYSILPYLKKHTELYEQIPNNDGDTSVLQSGDILIVPGHVKFAIAINGKLQEVQASLNGHAPETADRVSILDGAKHPRGYSKDGGSGRLYYIFRKKQ